MLIGYARVSTTDQDTEAQTNALAAAGCEKIYREHKSGGKLDRPELQRLLNHLRPGDTVIVWKLDRLTRSLRDMLTILDRINQEKAHFRSLTESIQTDTAAGAMLMQILASFAEFERTMIRERTIAGLIVARKNGRKCGRPRALTDEQESEIFRLTETRQRTATECARLFRVSPSIVSRVLSKARAKAISK